MRITHPFSKARFAVILLAAVVAVAGAPEAPGPLLARGAGDPPAEPVELAPRLREGGGPIPFEPGEMHLLALLQYLADASGTEVVYPEGRGVTTEVLQVTKRTDMADEAAVRAALARAGYDVSEENYRGRKVLWISRQLRPSGKKGAILRPGEEPRREEARDRKEPGPAAGTGAARIFTREADGRTTYLVVFETSSRAEAEDAQALIDALRSKREDGRSAAPKAGGKTKTRP